MGYGDTQGKVQNWAANDTVRERVKKEIMPLMDEARQNRQKLNFDWARYHKAWAKQHEFQAYQGKSNIYMPAAKRSIETLVAQTVAATFPGDEFFAAEPEKQEYSEMCADVQALEQNRTEDAKIRQHAEAYYRQLYMKGNSPGRVHWKSKAFQTVKRRKAAMQEADLYGIMLQGKPVIESTYEGPCFTPVVMEDFYGWPENVNNLEDASLVFEDFTAQKAELMRDARAGKYLEAEVEASGAAVIAEKESADTERLSGQGIVPPQGSGKHGGIVFVDASHVYCAFDPGAKDFTEEKNPVPFCFTITKDGHILRAVEARFSSPGAPHPYVMGRLGQITGRLYGSGVMEDIYPLQLLLNDQVNQSMDIGTWVLNPGIISNPNVLMGALSSWEPGFQVLATDVNNAMKEFRPPQEMIQSSAVLMTQTMSWLQEMSGAMPVLSGGSAPGRAFRTATGVGTAQNNAQLPLQQVVRSQETDTWQPLIKRFWALDRAFAKDPVLLSAGGPGAIQAARSINPMSLYGDYRFRWNASTQLMNVQVRGQQIMQALQVLSNPATMGALQQMGIRVNLAPLITRLMRDVFGFRDTDKILMQMPPPPVGTQVPGSPGQPPPMPPGMPPGGQQQQPAGAPGSNPLAGAQQGLDPGGAFGEVRQQANDLAGQFGGMNTPGEDQGYDPEEG